MKGITAIYIVSQKVLTVFKGKEEQRIFFKVIIFRILMARDPDFLIHFFSSTYRIPYFFFYQIEFANHPKFLKNTVTEIKSHHTILESSTIPLTLLYKLQVETFVVNEFRTSHINIL